MNVNILGIRGLPAAHGGFESFAAKLATFLIEKGHSVTVYCQQNSDYQGPREDKWNSIHRIHIAPRFDGPLGTIEFDWLCTKDVWKRGGVDLVLGYNTAIFHVFSRLKGRKIAINMDGIEWKRAKWGGIAKTWFFMNELIGTNLLNVPIADHPQIKQHLRSKCFKEIEVIPYGAEQILSANLNTLFKFGLDRDNYIISIARIEPENSILEMVRAFAKVNMEIKFVILGKIDERNEYHKKVLAAANENVIFLGAIYCPETVSCLRFYCKAYMHGHQVGGTNPSLVEALGAGNAVIAHNNRFNKWVLGEKHFYFEDEESLLSIFNTTLNNSDAPPSGRIVDTL